jgi:hypothetical protein
MTHSVAPVVSEIHEQKKDKPIIPGWLETEEGEFLEKNGVNTNPKERKEQSRQLGRYPTTYVGDSIRKTVKIFVCKSFNKQLNPNQDKKNRDRQHNWVEVQD